MEENTNADNTKRTRRTPSQVKNTEETKKQKPLKKETLNEEEKVKKAKARLKSRRPEYTKKRVVVPAISAIILVILGITMAIQSTFYQSTDDAFIEGHLIAVAPKVSGQVIKLYVDDNQEVKAGDLLLEIDPKDYQVKLKQAEAKLAAARAEFNEKKYDISQGQSIVSQNKDDADSLKSKMYFANRDYSRYSAMYKDRIVSKQEYDSSSTHREVSESNYKSASNKTQAAQFALEANKAKAQTVQADIKKYEAEVEQAKLELSYTKIYAPQSGTIASRSVEQGNYLQTAQPVMQVVPKKIWVIANFKEIQLTNMKKGQLVKIKVDTYPNKYFIGEVDSIQRATGAKSSLFPPENAVGSYVKIVQRVPVKIVFKEDISKYNIVPGMSVVPKVKIK